MGKLVVCLDKFTIAIEQINVAWETCLPRNMSKDGPYDS
jgi:hypothetical protein